jgi:hypothetical protein
LLTCASLNGLKDGAKDVGVVVTPLVLDDGDQALQSHAAVDVFTNKFFEDHFLGNFKGENTRRVKGENLEKAK